MPRIKNISARPILDSRGEWTIEVEIGLNDKRRVVASIPQGKSTGSHEAHYVGVREAILNVRKIIAPKLRNMDPTRQREIDEYMIRIDGTPNKKRIGANSILGVSIASARAGALVKGIPLWKHIRALSGLKPGTKKGMCLPRLFVNVVNGGSHAGNNLDIQEYLVIPKAKSFHEGVQIAVRFYQALREELVRIKGALAANLGDEGGFAPNFKDNLEPLRVMKHVAHKLRLSGKVDFGIDAAASSISKSSSSLLPLYVKMKRQFGISYIEDPFNEEKFDDFAKLRAILGKGTLVAGDDLTTTNVLRMDEARARKSVNAVIIKPNQIGTVSEALAAVRFARESGWAVVASHRSGETNDDFIADFAYGVQADGLKLGAPARGERIAKYNRLLEFIK